MYARISLVLLFVVILAFGARAATVIQNSAEPSAVLYWPFPPGSMMGQSGAVVDVNALRQDLVVGAPYAAHGNDRGMILLYYGANGLKSGGRPSAVIYGDGNLGWSLVGLGQGAFAAGAFSGSGDNVSLSGGVSIYRYTRGAPQKVADLSGENALDKFGYTLASGDFNGDGIQDLAVGAPFHSPDPSLYQQGAVYVYFGPDYSRSVKIPGTKKNGAVGFSIGTGDINKDGIDDLLIQSSGKVNAFLGSHSFSPNPDLPDIIYSSQDSSDTDFGRAIAVLRNPDPEEMNNVAVSASQATLNNGMMDMIDSGRVYIFGNSGGSASISAGPPARIDGEPNSGRFGSGLLPVCDLDGDGVQDLAVGSIHADGTSFPMTGAIYFISGRTMQLLPEKTIRGNARDMHFGTFLAAFVKGTYLAAGSPTEKDGNGSARIYRLK